MTSRPQPPTSDAIRLAAIQALDQAPASDHAHQDSAQLAQDLVKYSHLTLESLVYQDQEIDAPGRK